MSPTKSMIENGIDPDRTPLDRLFDIVRGVFDYHQDEPEVPSFPWSDDDTSQG